MQHLDFLYFIWYDVTEDYYKTIFVTTGSFFLTLETIKCFILFVYPQRLIFYVEINFKARIS